MAASWRTKDGIEMHQCNINIPEKHWQALKALAAQQDMSVAALFRRMVRERVEHLEGLEKSTWDTNWK